jgi:eukaryotic-like serine/threonine-protein kinase
MNAPDRIAGLSRSQPHAAGVRVGRFRLIDTLGRGAQATVWRAHDERLDREVALKLLLPGAEAISVHQWLHEARAVSRLSHPNIVPVFEADDANGQPYLVFELVRGRTLAEALRAGGAMPPRAAVTLLRGVLEALRAAHAQGIVHRDLKPSNILLDPDGRPRVMDFGIAARVSDRVGHICGTPGYMSPEAAQGTAPTAAMDVFAAGMILGELLSGKPLLQERDPHRALHRTIHEDVMLPESDAIDAALRAIVQRAVARTAGSRFDSAAALVAALDAWIKATDGPASAPESNGTLDFLLRRMRHKSDFPALSDAVVRIQRVAASDNESLNSLAAEILKDVALTHKLLRLVNTASFRHAGGGTISTVSRAIALVGFAGVRNMALSLVLLDHMHDKHHAAQLKEQFLCALMAGQLASELTVQAGQSEQSYLGAMLHNLGRLLTEFYLPEEARAIREELRPHAARLGDAAPTAEQASQRVLGLTFQQLGVGVARAWGLPESLQQCMRTPEGDAPARLVEPGTERLRWVARACNEMAEAVMRGDHGAGGATPETLATRYATALGVSPRQMAQAVEASRRKLRELADAMGLRLESDSPARRLIERAPSVASPAAMASAGAPIAEAQTLVTPRIETVPPALPPGDVLNAGIQDVVNTLAQESFRLNEVLRMILETMYRALGFRCVVFALKDPKSGVVTGRFGLGEGVQALVPQFTVSLQGGQGKAPDLLAAVCHKGVDTLIADATTANVAARLPAWLRRQPQAQTFLLLPMAMKGATFALIYADRAQPGSIAAGEKELSLLRTLRNQAVMAFRQAS